MVNPASAENSIEIFSVPVWGFMLYEHKYQSKDYVDVIESLEVQEPSARKSNFGGYQTHDNLHKHPVFREFVLAVENLATQCVGRVKMTDMWGNINYKNSYNGAHTHGGTLSGVFYLRTHNDCGRLILCNPAVRSDGHHLRKSNFPIVPENYGLILFPSWLEHYVEPNMTDEKRISLSFNLEKF